jgi:hypothetical protein
MKRILDYDPATKTVQFYHEDELTGDVALETRQDITPIVEHNKALFNQVDERARWGNGQTHIATIPNSILVKLAKITNNFKDKAAFDRWMDNPDNRVFRTRPGKLFRPSSPLRTR